MHEKEIEKARERESKCLMNKVRDSKREPEFMWLRKQNERE